MSYSTYSIGIPYMDIKDQIQELIFFYYKLKRPNIKRINNNAINHVAQSLMKFYKYENVYEIAIMDFPFDKLYIMEECTEIVDGKYRIRKDIMKDMKLQMKEYWKFRTTTYNAHSDSIIGLSRHPIENFICLTHGTILFTIDLYQI